METLVKLASRAGGPFVGIAVVIFVLLYALTTFGLIQAHPMVGPEPETLRSIEITASRIDDVHTAVRGIEGDLDRIDEHVLRETAALADLLEAMRDQTRSIDKLVYQLEQDRRARNGR